MAKEKLNKMVGMYNAARAMSGNAKIPDPKAQDLQDAKEKNDKKKPSKDSEEE